MKPFRGAGPFMKPGLLRSWQKAIAVFDVPGQDSEPVGLKFGEADDQVRLQLDFR